MKMIFGCASISFAAEIHHPFYSELMCWNGEHLGLSFLSLFNICVFGYVSLLAAACFYDYSLPLCFQPKEMNPGARSTNKPDMLLLISKMVLLVLFVAGPDNTWRIPLAVILLLTGAAYTIEMIRLLPFWVPWVQAIYTYQGLIITWCGVTAFIASLLDGMFPFYAFHTR